MKEFLGWLIDTESSTVSLPEQKHMEVLKLPSIPATQRRMSQKELESLVGELLSMHLAVSGAVAQLYHIQHALAQSGGWGGAGSRQTFIGKLKTGGH